MTVFTRTWDASYEASPADSDDAREGATRIRHLKNDIAERLEVDHSWAGDVSDGYHKLVTLLKQSSDPAALADAVKIYSKTVGQTERLFARNETENPFELWPAGSLRPSAKSTADEGWYLCDGSAKSRTTDQALFDAIGTAFGAGDGSTTFNIPKAYGRTFYGAGTAVTEESVTSSSSNGFVVASNTKKWFTGMAVVLSSLTGFTTSASAGPTYYVTRISATNIRLATTYALAVAETPNVTISGTGTATLTCTWGTLSVGEYVGEWAHGQVAGEVGPHTHPMNISNIGSDDLQAPGANAWFTSNTNTSANTATGPFNVMALGFVGTWQIKR